MHTTKSIVHGQRRGRHAIMCIHDEGVARRGPVAKPNKRDLKSQPPSWPVLRHLTHFWKHAIQICTSY